MAIRQTATDLGGVGTGVGSTVLIRHQFDQQGETTLLRPSVLWGGLTGAAAIAAPFLINGGRNQMLWRAIQGYGEGALAAAAFSAVNPVGGGVQLPTI